MTTEPQDSNVFDVDLRAKDNNVEHHTDELSTVDLIVRRGQSFCIHLEFKDAFKPDVHQLKFTASTGEHADENRGTKSVFGIPDFVKRSAETKAVWKAAIIQKVSTNTEKEESNTEEYESDPEKEKKRKRKRKKSDPKKKRKRKKSDPENKERKRKRDECCVFISIIPPVDAPAGKYSLSLNCSGGDKDLGSLTLLFNPWCTDDSVYMPKQKARQEYVMNEHGLIYTGTADTIYDLDWDYGQFEEDMLEIVFRLLHKSLNHLEDPGTDEASWGDPVYVGRVISAMINSSDDLGVLEGRWSGSYADGVSPTHWSGSYPILMRWFTRNCRPVKYGQCWVFAGVMCSVMRTLGIPCRVVTNFESAHDTDMNLTIDVYYTDYGAKEEESDDSVWNFHVWVEGWMKRPDLSEDGKYDGWQVLDPTPQELSGGVYQCGPASVKAIRKGKTDLKYDVPFVFAEVNADCVDWLNKADGSVIKLWSDTKRVGQNISTKCINREKRKDLTRKYKPREGSKSERAVFKHAISRDYTKNSWDMDSEESGTEEEEVPVTEAEEPEPELPKVSMKFEVSMLEKGKSVKLDLMLHSEATERRPLSIDISVKAKTYTGTARTDIKNILKQKTLRPGKDLCVPVVVPFSKYWKPMLDNDLMKVSAVVSDTHDDPKVYLAEISLALENPPIEVKVLNEAQVSQKVLLEISFVNPLSKTLKNCTLTLSGSGLCKEEKDISVANIGPTKSIKVKEHFVPYKAGKKTLVVDFDCSFFRDIKKSITIDVKKKYS